MHISHEAGIIEDPLHIAEEDIFSKTLPPKKAKDVETLLKIHFKNGIPTKVENLNDGTTKEDPLELFSYLNSIGSENGIGRLDMVENRFIGIKSRGIYETPGATILWIAHRDLEGIAMDKEVMHLRDMLSVKFSELIYNGFWFSPEMDFIFASIEKSQENIDGYVIVSIYKGNVIPIARWSPTSLYDEELASMDSISNFSPEDSKGFINIHATRLKVHSIVLREKNPYKWRKRLYGKTVGYFK